jgi:cation diffusion facilitator CzcD-associated flavoprotein CzcO
MTAVQETSTGASAAPDASAAEVLAGWAAEFDAALRGGDFAAAAGLFLADGYWRDMLSFTWDYRTFAGPAEIERGLAESVRGVDPGDFRPAPGRMAPRVVRRAGNDLIEGYLDFTTRFGRGTAFVRLRPEPGEPTRAWIVLTTLQELHGHEEAVGDRRPSGTEYSYNFAGDNWLDKRRAAVEYTDHNPQVLIIGGGQSGLVLAARLGCFGVDALVIERNKRIGDNWRHRYHSLTLHNEVWANSLPYIPFPESWPTFLPKDKLAGWLESYAEQLELNVWADSELLDSSFDEQTRTWTVRVRRGSGVGSEVREMVVPQLVLATGSVAGTPRMPELPGLDEFTGAGGEVMHSNGFSSGVRYRGRNAIVIGTGNSGHDVAQDLYSNGAASVTIIQRSPTCVVSLVPSGTMVYALYSEGPIEDIDLITACIPYPVLRDTYQWMTRKICELDADLLDRLRAVGFELDNGPDETGFHMKYLRNGGGYYINVGCADLIADGEIKLAHARDIATFDSTGLRLSDGRHVPADLVVAATGYDNQTESIRKLLGDQVASRVGEVWGFNEHGFMRNMWTRTGQDRFWLMGGALNECRLFSRFLALRIKADLLGLTPLVR